MNARSTLRCRGDRDAAIKQFHTLSHPFDSMAAIALIGMIADSSAVIGYGERYASVLLVKLY